MLWPLASDSSGFDHRVWVRGHSKQVNEEDHDGEANQGIRIDEKPLATAIRPVRDRGVKQHTGQHRQGPDLVEIVDALAHGVRPTYHWARTARGRRERARGWMQGRTGGGQRPPTRRVVRDQWRTLPGKVLQRRVVLLTAGLVFAVCARALIVAVKRPDAHVYAPLDFDWGVSSGSDSGRVDGAYGSEG